MKQFFTTVLFTSLFFTTATAQLFFTPGRVITTQGDTLQGEIKERGNTTISLRTGSTSLERMYTPDQVVSYTTEGVTHVSATLAENGRTSRLFLRERIKGYVSLYSLGKPDGELAYALQLPDQSFVPLRGKMAWSALNRNLIDCPAPAFQMKLESRNFFYAYSYFEQIVTAYNQYKQPGKSTLRTKSPFNYEIGPLAGVAQNRWNYTFFNERYAAYFNPNGLYPTHNTIVVGGFATLMPRKRLSLTLEVLFTHYKGGRITDVRNPLDPSFRESRYYAFQEQFLALPITGRYMFLNRPVRCYLKGGPVVTYSLTLKGELSGSNLVTSAIPMRNGTSVGYLVGLGAEIPLPAKRRLAVEVRTMPHIAKDGATRVGDSRSTQLTLSMPLLVR